MAADPRIKKLEWRVWLAAGYIIPIAGLLVALVVEGAWGFAALVFIPLVLFGFEAATARRKLRQHRLGLVPPEDEPRPPWAM